MAVTPVPNVASQLERAVAAYLAGNGIAGAIVPAWYYGDLIYPCTTIHAASATINPINTLNKEIRLDITCMGSAVQPNSQADAQAGWAALNTNIGLVDAMMLQTYGGGDISLVATADLITTAGRALASMSGALPENADMAVFTLQKLYYRGDSRGKPEDGSCAWAEIRHFEAHCCSTVINP